MSQEEQQRFDELSRRLQTVDGKTQLQLLWPLFLWLLIMPLFMTSIEMWMGGIAVTLLLFLAAQYLIRRHARINRVVTDYISHLGSDGFTNGLDTLLKSGALELNDRFEMREVCCKIRKRTKSGQNPNYMETILPNRKILPFLKFCQKNRCDISSAIDAAVVIHKFNRGIKH